MNRSHHRDPGRRGGLRARGLATLLAGASLFPVLPALSEPHIAFREGLKCSACHVNHTGGGMRNGYGALFTQTEIAPLLDAMSQSALGFSADLGSSVAIGADFIASNQTLLAVDEDLVANGGGRLRFSQDGQNTFAVESGNLYVQARLVPGHLSLYFDETVAPGSAANREVFALLEGLPASSYLKMGRLLLPFGIRVWDDETFVRQATGFNYDNQDLGVELGLEPGPVSLSLALTNGSQGARDDNRGKQLSAVGFYWMRHAVVGGSVAVNDSRGVERLVVGPLAGLRVGPLTWMGEVDIARTQAGDGVDNDQLLAFTSLEYWYRSAVSARVGFDFHDPYDAVEQDERSRLSIGLDAFLTPFLTAGIYYRSRDSIPQDVEGNADALTVSLHTFF